MVVTLPVWAENAFAIDYFEEGMDGTEVGLSGAEATGRFGVGSCLRDAE